MNLSTFSQASSMALLLGAPLVSAASTQPNIILIITDDHSVNTLGSCDKDTLVPLNNIRRLANEGMSFDRSYCANSLSGPSRACIMTGRHSHKNGFVDNSGKVKFDGTQPTWPKMLKSVGYQTAYIGKWHLESDPIGFDWWDVLAGQGDYWDSFFISKGPDGQALKKKSKGYVSELITDKALAWLKQREDKKPFALVVGHKAPHRNWIPAARHLAQIKACVATLTPPASLMDDYKNRPGFLSYNEQSLAHYFCNWSDAHLVKSEIPFDIMKDICSTAALEKMIASGQLKGRVPADFDLAKHEPLYPAITFVNREVFSYISDESKDVYTQFYTQRTQEFVAAMQSGKIKNEEDMTIQRWRWYMEDYLGTLISVDESIGQILDYVDEEGLAQDTLVIYAADQGFFIGEHGLFDKRWILEESLRMPLIMRFPGKIAAGVRSQALVQNIDYAPTFCDLAGADSEENKSTFDGRSIAPLFATGAAPSFENRALYYAYFENPGPHNVPRHDGIRTQRFTYSRINSIMPNESATDRKREDEWMLFDNEKDPQQMRNLINDPAYAASSEELHKIYKAKRTQFDVPDNSPGRDEDTRFAPSW